MNNRLIILFLLLSSAAFAQPREKVKERIHAQRIAYITERLELSPEEAQKFWPIYNQFTAEMEQIKREMNDRRKATNDNLKKMSDQEIEQSLADDLVSQQKIIDLQRKYQVELRKAIPVRKIAQLYKTERDFKLQLLKRMRDAGHPPPPPEDEF
jgi:Skp family chaperone for outer membrane proteins